MNRYREDRDTAETESVTWTGSSSGTAGTYTVPNGLKTCSDVVTPRFHSRIKAGAIINNPCSITDSYTGMPGGSLNYTRTYYNSTPTWNTTYSGPIWLWLSDIFDIPLDLDVSTNLDLVAMAKLKALSNIDSTPYSFAEDLAEIRTTVRHLFSRGQDIRHLNETLSRAIRKVKSQRFKKNAATISREISQLYLEYRFAISPLIRSIADLMEAANSKLGSSPVRDVSRGFEKYSKTKTSTVPFGGSWNASATGTRETEHLISAGVLYSVTNPLSGFRFKYGLRNKDIPVTMWAIVPYSFMVDRVFNISQALRAVTNLLDPDVHIHTAWVRSKVKTESTYSADGSFTQLSSDSVRVRSISGSRHQSESFDYIRSPWAPSLADTIPTPTWVKLVDSFTKIADITALAHVNLSKGR